MNIVQTQQQLKQGNVFLRALNLALMILDVPYFIFWGFEQPELFPLIIIFHGLVLSQSFLYQADPEIANKLAFQINGHVVAVLTLVLLYFHHNAWINQEDPSWRQFNEWSFFMFTLPLTVLSFTLLLIIWVQMSTQKARFILVPQRQVKYQEAMV